MLSTVHAHQATNIVRRRGMRSVALVVGVADARLLAVALVRRSSISAEAAKTAKKAPAAYLPLNTA